MKTTVNAVMARTLVTASLNTTVPEAVKLLKSGEIRCLPVLDGTRLVGIVTDRDLKEAMPSQATSLSIWEITSLLASLTVREVMTTSVLTTTPDAPLSDAAYTMLQHKVGGLPVIDADHQLVGMVTVTDVLREYVGLPVESVS
ncbi:CBS domain-containing protein [Deinococcus sp.]|uniref:CBS domain-containing protein n=1 Tax=Deinococcus sp. TaxID=47478 RepID=UPI0025E481F5|nr:CBS domain-containing protein [Deinococcus sp.]